MEQRNAPSELEQMAAEVKNAQAVGAIHCQGEPGSTVVQREQVVLADPAEWADVVLVPSL
jgi:hypothetical protein